MKEDRQRESSLTVDRGHVWASVLKSKQRCEMLEVSAVTVNVTGGSDKVSAVCL